MNIPRFLPTVFLVLGMAVLASILGVGTAVAADDPRSELAGNGTESDPFVITTAEELQRIDAIETYRENELDDVEQFHYVVENDIDATDTEEWDAGDGFDPIGERRGPTLTGTFDGQGHTISGLHIAKPNTEYVGLFGYSEGTIENVQLTNVTVIGNGEVGAVVGRNDDAGSVQEVTVTGEIKGTDKRVGGVVGRNYGEITASSMVGNVESLERHVGGIAGQNQGAIDKSYFVGTVSGEHDVGGIVGNSQGSLRAVFATGDANGENRVGGVVGSNDGAVSEVYSLVDVEGEQTVSGLIATNSGTISGGYAAGSVDSDGQVAGLVGSNDGIVESVYWDVDRTGTEAGIGDTNGKQKDVVALEPWELTGENVTENTALDFDSPWTTTEGYPRLEWEDDRDVPDEVYELEIQTEEPEPPSEEEESETDDGDDESGVLPVSPLLLLAAVVLLAVIVGGGFYSYRQLQATEEQPERPQRRRRS